MMFAHALALGAGGRVPFYPEAAVALGFSTGQAHPSLTDALNGAPSLDYDPTGRAWGARCESAGANQAWNTSLAGAVLGAVGSGGSLPTGWTTANSVAGLTVTVGEASGDEIQIALSGTPSGNGDWLLQFCPTTTAVVAAAETWTGSYDLCQIGTATGVNSWKSGMIERNASGTFVTSALRVITPQTDTLWPVEQRRTIASGVRLTHALGISVTSGVAVSATFRLRRPQLEKSAYRTSFMASTSGNGARTATALSLKNAATLYASAWASSTGFRAGANATGTVRQWDDGTDANRLTLFVENYVAKLEIVAASVVVETLTLGPVVRWAYNRVTVSADAGVIRASLNGKATDVSVQSPPSISRDQLALGARAALNGWIGDVEVWTRLFSVGEVASYSIPVQSIFDDFDRADGALQGTVAATGQTWLGVEAGEGPSNVAMQISGGRAVTADSGVASTASYTAYNPGTILRAWRASVVFSAGTGTANATMISNPLGLDDVADITGRSLHLSFRQDKVDVAYFEGGSINYVGFPAYQTALATDGSTVHHFGYRTHGDAVIVEMADGTLERVLSATAMSKAGVYHTFESFWQGASAPRSSFVAVHGEA